jgi:IclR family acetate operon transcriptional repressor
VTVSSAPRDGTPRRGGERLIAIVESFIDSPRQTLSEISARSGIDPATSTRYLKQLVERGWLEKDPTTRNYSPGIRLYVIGQLARDLDSTRRRALPKMRELRDQYDETINMGVFRGREVVIIEAIESKRSIRTGATVGEVDEWFASSLGKSILAHLPADEVEEIVAAYPPVRHTEHSLVTLDEIMDDLALVRERGYALDDQESEIGLKCVGVPIIEPGGIVTHAISISGPARRIDDHLDRIVESMRVLAVQLGVPKKVES